VWAGYSNKDSVAAKLPELDNFMAFPTMIIIDKNDRVRQIHTGFDGPASSKFADFKKEFDETIRTILNEK
jgi:hypothetical protein